MTLTYPALNRARRVLWLITGEDKAAMLVRLRRGDPAIPAGRVRQDHAMVLADRAAAQHWARPPEGVKPRTSDRPPEAEPRVIGGFRLQAEASGALALKERICV